jgi:hypothetical protein
MSIDARMEAMPHDWRYRWCEAEFCACLGAANCSGRLLADGVTKTAWSEWVAAHPQEPAAVYRTCGETHDRPAPTDPGRWR